MGELIDLELKKRGIELRGLARLLAGEEANHKQLEAWRRKLYHYRKDSLPTEATATYMETTLGHEAGYFPRSKPTRQRSASNGARITQLEADMAELRRLVQGLRRK